MIFPRKTLQLVSIAVLISIISIPVYGAPIQKRSGLDTECIESNVKSSLPELRTPEQAMPCIKFNVTPEEEFQRILKNAERGMPEFMSLVGDMYLDGRIVEKNDDKAAEWFSKAALLNDAQGLYGMGYLHAEGKGGLPKDDAKAFNFFMQAFEKGFPPASMWIGEFYRDGRGVKQDREKALLWFAAACAGGEDGARNALAGRPTEEQRQKAEKLMHKTFRKGEIITCHTL